MADLQILGDLKQAKEEHAKVMNAINSDRLILESLSKDISKANEVIKTKNSEIEMLENEIENKKVVLGSLDIDISEKKSLISLKSSEIKEIEKLIEEKTNILNEIIEKISKTKEKHNSDFIEMTKKLESKKNELESEIDTFKINLEIVIDENENAVMYGNKLIEREKLLKEEIDVLGDSYEKIKNDISEAEIKRDSYTELINEKKQELLNAEKDLKEINDGKLIVIETIEKLKSEAESLGEEINKLKATRIAIAQAGEEVKQAYQYIAEWYKDAGMTLPKVNVDWSGL